MNLDVLRLGLSEYQTTWDLQKQFFDECLAEQRTDTLILCEHPHTFTIGKDGVENADKNLLWDRAHRERESITVFEIDRGGDITYHGPGQIVGYPILNLNHYYRDVHLYLRDIEEVIIRALAEFGIHGKRIEKITGVWIETPRGAEKICAIGVKVTRWITMHGFALNVNSDLSFFDGIVPCGITDKGVTSMQNILGRSVPQTEVENSIVSNFANVFKVDIKESYARESHENSVL